IHTKGDDRCHENANHQRPARSRRARRRRKSRHARRRRRPRRRCVTRPRRPKPILTTCRRSTRVMTETSLLVTVAVALAAGVAGVYWRRRTMKGPSSREELENDRLATEGYVVPVGGQPVAATLAQPIVSVSAPAPIAPDSEAAPESFIVKGSRESTPVA